MMIKRQPSDFRVEEVSTVSPTEGEFCLYLLRKTGLTTFDAVKQIRQRWHLDSDRISHGGLKDRHAETEQFFTVFRGPERNLSQNGIQVQYLGRVARPFRSEDILANRFHLVIRDLTDIQIDQAGKNFEDIRKLGIPNYFDDQRFGFIRTQNEFFAKLLLQGKFELALQGALTRAYEFDSASQKKEKKWLRDKWGQWSEARSRIRNPEIARVLGHLASHPTDFRGGILRLRRDLCVLWLSAYQSYLWNQMLALWIRNTVPTDDCLNLPSRLGPLPATRAWNSERSTNFEATLPYPHHQVRWSQDDFAKPLMDEVLLTEGWTQATFRLKGMEPLFFSKGERPMFFLPSELEAKAASDELYPNRRKWTLSFTLPRGSYATLVVKRLLGMDPQLKNDHAFE